MNGPLKCAHEFTEQLAPSKYRCPKCGTTLQPCAWNDRPPNPRITWEVKIVSGTEPP